MTTAENYSPEVAERLGKEMFELFWALPAYERNDRKISTLFYDMAHLFKDATPEVQYWFEEQLKKTMSVASDKLLVLIQGYTTTSRVAYNTRLCVLFQNMITETATTLDEWKMVFINESPSQSTCKKYLRGNHILPGIMKNVALQQILLLANTWQDVEFVLDNTTPGTKLHSSALLKKAMMSKGEYIIVADLF